MEAESLFAELKRRRVFRALVGYGIAAFAILQIIEPLMNDSIWLTILSQWMPVVHLAAVRASDLGFHPHLRGWILAQRKADL